MWTSHGYTSRITGLLLGKFTGHRQIPITKGQNTHVAWSTPSHYLNQPWNIVNWAHRNKLQWNFKRNSYILIPENPFQPVVWKSRPFCFGLNELKLVSLQFPAHRLVLASHSPYFEKMFKSPLMEGSQSTIRLHETQPEYFKLLLEFMYSGRLAITDGNVKVSNGKSFSLWVRSFQLKVALPLAFDSVRSLL